MRSGEMEAKERHINLQIYDGNAAITDALLYGNRSAADTAQASKASLARRRSRAGKHLQEKRATIFFKISFFLWGNSA
jgi:hypothetical protein